MKFKNAWNAAYTLILLVMITLGGCTKDSNTINTTGDGPLLSFTVAGIAEDADIQPADLSGATGTTASAGSRTARKTENLGTTVFKGLEIQTNAVKPVDNGTAAAVESNGSAAKMAAKPATVMATSPLSTGFTYRILVYTKAGAYVGAVDGKSGTAASTIQATQGDSYVWYAYSLNKADALPALANTATPQIAVTPKDDLLFATGMIEKAGYPDTKTQITFSHAMAAVRVVFDTQGCFAPIDPASTITGPNLKGGTFSLITNSFTSTAAQSVTVTGSDWKQVDPLTTKDLVQYVTFYTTEATGPKNFNITSPLLRLKLDWKQSLGTQAVADFTGYSAAFGNVGTTYGKRYNYTLTLVENGRPMGGKYWAQGNLYYNYTDGKYRFRHNEEYPYADRVYPWRYGITNVDPALPKDSLWSAADKTGAAYNNLIFKRRPVEYWNANMTYPYIPRKWMYKGADNVGNVPANYFPSTDMRTAKSGDPCKLVYPLNKWRLPTQQEAQNMLNEFVGMGTRRVYDDATNFFYVAYVPYTDNSGDIFRNRFEFSANGMIFNPYSKNYPPTSLDNEYGTSYANSDMVDYVYTNRYTFGYSYTSNRDNKNKQGTMRYWTSTPAPADAKDPDAARYYSFYMNMYQNTFLTGKSPLSLGYNDETTGYGTRPAAQHYGLNIRCVRADK